jgi:hypothetical protein
MVCYNDAIRCKYLKISYLIIKYLFMTKYWLTENDTVDRKNGQKSYRLSRIEQAPFLWACLTPNF